MALFRTWVDDHSSDTTLFCSAVDDGLHRLGYASIKSEQLDTVESLLRGEDVFMSGPIGFGKSLIYQLLLFCAESLLRTRASTQKSLLVVVIAPLLSLMYDQVSKLVAKGVKAVVHFWREDK